MPPSRALALVLVVPVTLACAVQLGASAAHGPGAGGAHTRQSQPPRPRAHQPLTEAAVRALVRQAHTEARGDANDLILALDRHVRDAWGDFESFPPFVVQRDDLHVTIAGPYMTFRKNLIDALRTKRRIDQVSWVNAVVVDVEPLRLGAPDIESVSLSRAGAVIGPLHPGLRPMTFTNGAGATGVMHAGAIHFPPSAFAPGQAVALTLRVAAGQPIVHTFDAETLRTLK